MRKNQVFALLRWLVVFGLITNLSCKKSMQQNTGSSVADVYGPVQSTDIKHALLKQDPKTQDLYIFETCNELVSENAPYNQERLLNCKVQKTSAKLTSQQIIDNATRQINAIPDSSSSQIKQLKEGLKKDSADKIKSTLTTARIEGTSSSEFTTGFILVAAAFLEEKQIIKQLLDDIEKEKLPEGCSENCKNCFQCEVNRFYKPDEKPIKPIFCQDLSKAVSLMVMRQQTDKEGFSFICYSPDGEREYDSSTDTRDKAYENAANKHRLELNTQDYKNHLAKLDAKPIEELERSLCAANSCKDKSKCGQCKVYYGAVSLSYDKVFTCQVTDGKYRESQLPHVYLAFRQCDEWKRQGYTKDCKVFCGRQGADVGTNTPRMTDPNGVIPAPDYGGYGGSGE